MNPLAYGLLLAIGWALILWSAATPHAPERRPASRVEDALAEAGLADVQPYRFVLVCLGSLSVTWLLVLGFSSSTVIATFLALIAAMAPWALVKYRQRKRRDELRAVWPDAIDHLSSGIRAGLSLPEALAQLAVTGPTALQPAFQQFADDYRVSGRFEESLDRLKHLLADPVGDRVVESLRIAREVGGQDLGRLLRSLSGFLRDDLRTRGELESRQSWTINAARLAVAAPWVLLLLLSLRPEAVAAYDSGAGMAVLAIGAAVSFVAYRLMMRLGRLPVEARVLK